MPYCPRCGLEVDEETKYCPRCGTEIRPVNEFRVEHRSAIGHISYAFNVAKSKPWVFAPSIIGTIFSVISLWMLESWTVYRKLSNELLNYFYSQSGIHGVSYIQDGFNFDWSLLISWILLAFIVLSLASWLSSLASYKASWMALNGEEPKIHVSFSYILHNIFRFIVGSFYVLLFTLTVGSIYIFLVLGSVRIGLAITIVIGLSLSLILLIVIIMASPTFLIMVVENTSFVPALRNSFSFTIGALGPYLFLMTCLWIMTMIITLIIPYGEYLSFPINVIIDIAVMDLYVQTRIEKTL